MEDWFNQLKVAYNNNRLAQAILFYGPQGIGKKKKVIDLASFILKSDVDDLLRHPDYFFLSDDQQIKVADIKEAIKFLYEKPLLAEEKVLVINHAQNMNEEAQNKFLKSYEDVPANCFIFLITSRKNKILSTIQSRALQVSCKPLQIEEIREELLQKVDQKSAYYASHYSLGSKMRAQKMIEDQQYKRMVFLPRSIWLEIERKSELSAIQKVNQMQEEHIEDFLQYLNCFLVDIYRIMRCQKDVEILYKDYRDEISRYANKYRPEDVVRAQKFIEETKQRMEHNVNARICLHQCVRNLVDLFRNTEMEKL